MHILVTRLGAYGDCLVLTPVLRELKAQGHEITMITSERGRDVFARNPHIDHLRFQESDKVPINDLKHYWTELNKDDIHADKEIHFSESIEVALAVHPRDPVYNYPKFERFLKCNRNYYEYAMEWAGLYWKGKNINPELFFSTSELKTASKLLDYSKYNVLLCLSGSGKHKTYPWFEPLIGSILNEWPDAHVITVGDYICKLLEAKDDRITNLAGEVNIRTAMALTGMVDLVISPDTGILHASACYDTPKVGLLGHTTIENITKHFFNDYSIESDPEKAECSPCFRLIYNMQLQCPTDIHTKAAYCMAHGLQAERVFEQVKKAHDRHGKVNFGLTRHKAREACGV